MSSIPEDINVLKGQILGTSVDTADSEFISDGPEYLRTRLTTSERIITRAINALSNSEENTLDSVEGITNRLNRVVGHDMTTDMEDFLSLGGNLIHAAAQMKNTMQNKLPPGVTDNIMLFSGIEGQVKDSGVKISDIGTGGGGAPVAPKTIYLATADGNDNANGSSSETPVKTIARVRQLAGGALTLHISKYKSLPASDPKAIPEQYNTAAVYSTGDRVSYMYTFERTADGTATAPTMNNAAWRFVCIDEVDSEAVVNRWNSILPHHKGEIVFKTGISLSSPRVTYVCLEDNLGEEPPDTMAPTKYWCPVGPHNPILPETENLQINNLAGLTLISGSEDIPGNEYQLVVALSNLDLSRNEFVDIGAQLVISDVLTFENLASAQCRQRIFARELSVSNNGVVAFKDAVSAFDRIILENNGQASFYSTVNVCTGAAGTNAITINGGAGVAFMNAITLTAFNVGAGNTAIGLLARGSARVFLGGGTLPGLSNTNVVPAVTNTIEGFATAIRVDESASVENYATQTIMRALDCDAAQAYALFIGNSGTFVSGRRAAVYTRTNATGFPDKTTIDKIELNGNFVDYKTIPSGNVTGNTIYSVTAETSGHRIKTDIHNGEAGSLRLELKGWGYTARFTMIDTEVACFINADGTLTPNSLQQINKGWGLRQAAVYLDTDDTWTIYLGGTVGRGTNVRLDAYVSFLTNSDDGETATPYSSASLYNRVSGITPLRGALGELPTGAEPGYLLTTQERMYNVVQQNDMYRDVFIATGDGDDTGPMSSNPTRSESFKTIEAALANIPRNCFVVFYINKYKDPARRNSSANIAQYSSGFEYAVGDRMVHEGYVYERVVAGTGTTPTLTMTTPWKHVNIATPSRGNYSGSIDYVSGDTVFFNGLTYVCVAAARNIIPDTVVTSPQYWVPCGEFNPVIPGDLTIAHYGGVNITNGDANIRLIFLADRVVITHCKWMITNTPIYVYGTLEINKLESLLMNQTLEANIPFIVYLGVARFVRTVTVRGRMRLVVNALVYFDGNVIAMADALNQYGIEVSQGTKAVFYGSVNITGMPGVNAAHGLLAQYCGHIITYGNITVSGCLYSVTSSSSTVEIRSATVNVSRGTNTATNSYAMAMTGRGLMTISPGTTINRNGLSDHIATGGMGINLAKLTGVWP